MWADVIAHILSKGRCYCHCLCGSGRPLNCMLQHLKMADGYCQVADGITTLYSIRRLQMLFPSGRWNNHFRVGDGTW